MRKSKGRDISNKINVEGRIKRKDGIKKKKQMRRGKRKKEKAEEYWVE